MDTVSNLESFKHTDRMQKVKLKVADASIQSPANRAPVIGWGVVKSHTRTASTGALSVHCAPSLACYFKKESSFLSMLAKQSSPM